MCKNAQQRHDISHNNKCYETKLVNVFKPPTEVCLTHLPACDKSPQKHKWSTMVL